jgi:very-short-patch-repair endonuclease
MDLRRLDEVIPLLDPTAVPRVLDRQGALALGYSRNAIEHRLRAGRWRRVLPRTFLTVDTLTWEDRRSAALLFAGAGALLSGAAALTDLRLRCVGVPSSVLVLVPLATAVRSTAWVRVRRTRCMPERALLPGPARAALARAVADLARERPALDDVRTLLAQAVRSRLCTVDELTDELHAGPRNGSAHLRRALAEVSAGAWSAPEARAARILTAARIRPFEQNARIELPGGGDLIVDFLWRELRAVLEIDSVEHHLDPVDWRATMDRHLQLETLGFSVVHRTPALVATQPTRFVREIDAWLQARAHLLGRRSIGPGAAPRP